MNRLVERIHDSQIKWLTFRCLDSQVPWFKHLHDEVQLPSLARACVAQLQVQLQEPVRQRLEAEWRHECHIAPTCGRLMNARLVCRRIADRDACPTCLAQRLAVHSSLHWSRIETHCDAKSVQLAALSSGTEVSIATSSTATARSLPVPCGRSWRTVLFRRCIGHQSSMRCIL